MHRANADDSAIPEALVGVIVGIASLNDFQSEGTVAHLEPAAMTPDFTTGSSHYMAPADFATIYDVNSLYSSNIDGMGTSIAVVARSDLKLADVQAFRAMMGLPANPPTLILNGPDPGVLSSDQAEATLDVEWAGAVAKKAAVKVVVSKSTAASDGVTLSAQYIVNHKVAPVMTTSYSACEAAAGFVSAQFWSSLWQQAAAEGITSLIASGDSGAANAIRLPRRPPITARA
jgi:subtilase family serine protease